MTITPCDEWTGYRNKRGYGNFYIGCDQEGKQYRMLAHRLVWATHHGEIPSGIEICHTCDNPSCIEITHLFAGTKQENMADMVAKGRQSKGDTHPRSKLNDRDVAEILWFRSAGVDNRHVARMYGISRSHVSNITAGRDRVLVGA